MLGKILHLRKVSVVATREEVIEESKQIIGRKVKDLIGEKSCAKVSRETGGNLTQDKVRNVSIGKNLPSVIEAVFLAIALGSRIEDLLPNDLKRAYSKHVRTISKGEKK